MKLAINRSCQNLAIVLSLFICSSVIPTNVNAEIFKCTNSKNEVFYNDKPCSATEIERKIKAVKDPVGGYIAPTASAQEEVKGARKFTVVGEEATSSGNVTTNSNSSASEEISGGQGSGSQTSRGDTTKSAGQSKQNTTSAQNNNSPRKYKAEDGTMVTRQEIIKASNLE